MVDFWRYNTDFLVRVYSEQPYSPTGTWNRMEYRPLEGFVFAVRPFNSPRIVGETGGKSVILAHPSAEAEAVATAVVRGSFEYQGQKCSAASRLYVPSNLWPEVKERLVEDVATIKMGDPADFENF